MNPLNCNEDISVYNNKSIKYINLDITRESPVAKCPVIISSNSFESVEKMHSGYPLLAKRLSEVPEKLDSVPSNIFNMELGRCINCFS